jgi:hypothetical protein
MRLMFRGSAPVGISLAAIALLLFAGSANAAGLKEAQVTQIVKEVHLLPGQAAARPAAIRDSVRQGMAVRTGTESRTELTFTDQTLARLGANTIFSFSDGARKVDLGGGAMLLSVPEGGATATVRTAAVTAAVSGGTALLEHHKNAYAKLINLEGILRVALTKHPNLTTTLRPGQMLIVKVDATSLPEPVDVDLEKLVRSCLLITDFPPLANESLIAEAIRSQQEQVAQGTLVPTEVIYNDDGTIMTLVDPTSFDLISLVAIGPAGPAAPLFLIVTYTGAAGGNWSNLASWNPAVVPNNTAVTLFNAVIPSGLIIQDIATGVKIQQLQMQGGTLQLDNPLSLNTGLLFTGGSIIGGNLSIAGTSTQATPMGVQNTVISNTGIYDLTFDSANAFSGSPGTSSFNNLGTLRKTNGFDMVNFNMSINNSGTISVASGVLLFSAGGTNSGTFSTAAGSSINFASDFSMQSGTVFAGPGLIGFGDGTNTTLAGTITNTGNLLVNSAAFFTDFILNGNVTLTGGGVVNLNNTDRILGNGVLTTNNTIQGDTAGGGSIGANQIGIVLQAGGVIDANRNGFALDIDPNPANGFVNQGTLRASNGGLLVLNGNGDGGFANSGGLITALNASQVQLTNGAAITGGTLSTAGTGVIRNLNTASLTSLTNAGNFIANDNSTTLLTGTITNSGSISLNSTANFTDLILNGNVTLTGGGQLNLANAARVLGNGILTNVNNTIHGNTLAGGSLGANQIGIVNQVGGVIDADGGGILDVDPDAVNGLLNQGTMRASNGGALVLNGNGGGGFNNTGTIETVAGGTLQFNGAVTSSGLVDVDGGALTVAGSYSQTAGTFRLAGGSVNSASILNFLGGLVDARGTITGSINNGATFRPALGGSGLNVNGNVTLLNTSNLSFQLGGITQGSQYSFLNVNGTVGLAGNLVLSFANGFQNSVTGANTFTILSSTAALSGTFANIASGDRLATSDLSGSFLVTYSGNSIVLSDFHLGLPITAAVWTGTTGNWSDPTKWTSNPNFPNNGQPAPGSVYDATLDNGGTITLNIPITIENFTLNGGTVAGANNLTINQLFTWSAGAMSVNGVINANGGIAFGNTQLDFTQGTLNNAAGQTATLSGAGAQIGFQNGAIFNNNGTFLAQNDRSLFNNGGGGTFNNNGIFTRDTSAGTFSILTLLAFNNTGTVNVNTGTLALFGGDGGSTTGDFNIAAGAALQLASDFTFAASSTISGAGSGTFTNGTQQINGTYTLPVINVSGTANANFNTPTSVTTVNLSGGTLGGSGTLDINGLFSWSGGSLVGAGVTNANGGIAFGNGQVNLNQRTLNNAAGQTATLSAASGPIAFLNGAIFNNNGTFLAQNNQSFFNNGGGGTFNNAGIFTRDTSAGTFSILTLVAFNNSGTVNVQTGTLRFIGGDTGNTTGDFNISAGAILNFSSNFSFAASSDLAGAGTVFFQSGNQVLNGTYSLADLNVAGAGVTLNIPLSVAAFNFISGTVIANSPLSVSGLLTWSSGNLGGSSFTNANGGILFNGAAVGLIGGTTLNNAAGQTATLSNPSLGGIGFQNGSIFNNNGTFLAQNNAGFFNNGGEGTFNNNGIFTRDTSAGTFSILTLVAFNNTGTVNVNSGTLALNSTTTSSGPINVNGATLSLGGTFTQTADSINLFAGTLSVGGNASAHLITGTSGTMNVAATGILSSANGLDFRGVNGLGTSGGTLTFTAPSITFAAAGINGALFTGGDAAPGSGVAGGNGGNFTVTATTDDIVVGADIDASTGANDAVPNGGNGGTVNLTANQGTVTVNNRIQVSGSTAGRQSAAGGNINITSGRLTGVAIEIGNSAQLLSLLDAVAPGPGGKITMLATGTNSQVNVAGNVAANHSSGAASAVDIRHTGAAGTISLSGAANITADIIKVAALGSNGVLTIGLNTQLNANSVLKLYAEGSNGQIVFAGTCTIGSGNFNIIAAPTVTVNPGVNVTVNGAPAQIFTNLGNYSAVNGGNGGGGTFIGSGATTDPTGFAGRPALGPPGGP